MRKTPLLALLLASCGIPPAATTSVSVATPQLADPFSVEKPPIDASTRTSTSGRVLIRNAELTFEIDNKDEQRALRTRVIDAVDKLGGYAAGEHESSLVLRVPSNELDAALKSLE